MSSETEQERYNKVFSRILDIASIPAYFCPLFEVHERAYAFLTIPQLMGHLLNHTDQELEMYREYNSELWNELNKYEEENETEIVEYYNMIPLPILGALTMSSERALGVYDYRISKTEELTPDEEYQTLTEEEKEDLKAEREAHRQIVGIDDEDNIVYNGFDLVHKDNVDKTLADEEKKDLNVHLEEKENSEAIKEHLEDLDIEIPENLKPETEEE